MSLFTSESVSMGHPDKVADQISDAILDAMLAQDPKSRCAIETMVTTGLVVVAGEVTTNGYVAIPDVVRQTIKEIGYDDATMGFEYDSSAVMVTLDRQSPDIAQGVNVGEGLHKEQGAGDQGLMFGYATDESSDFMPLPVSLSHKLLIELTKLRQKKKLPYLRPDAKSQVTLEYDDATGKPTRIHTVVISTQHTDKVTLTKIRKDLIAMCKRVLPTKLIDNKTIYHINPTGKFVIGGPKGDCGLTGRKIIVDTYGGMGRHGGGAFSGKDPSKVDRSAAYAARHVAKNLVAAKAAKRCEVQLAYAIGVPQPVSIKVDTFGTGICDDATLSEIVTDVFDISPAGIIKGLNLLRPIYRHTAYHGHFGRKEFPWEELNKVAAIQKGLKKAGVDTTPKRGRPAKKAAAK